MSSLPGTNRIIGRRQGPERGGPHWGAAGTPRTADSVAIARKTKAWAADSVVAICGCDLRGRDRGMAHNAASVEDDIARFARGQRVADRHPRSLEEPQEWRGGR
jgi:hypothetical protein